MGQPSPAETKVDDVEEANDNDDDDDDSVEEGFALLLGGRKVHWGDIATAFASSTTPSPPPSPSSASSSAVATNGNNFNNSGRSQSASHEINGEWSDKADDDKGTDSIIGSLAHGCVREHSGAGGASTRSRASTVRVVDVPHKGSGLVACVPMTQGRIVFTERAAVACQMVPARTSHPTIDGKCVGTWTDGDLVDDLYRVRACQQCFRSLEPCLPGLPHPELWPTGTLLPPELQSQCPQCKTCFCSQRCRQLHNEQFGSCCDLRNATIILCRPIHDDEAMDDPAIHLAVRMLRHCLERHRRQEARDGSRYAVEEEGEQDESVDVLIGTVLQGLCGDAADLTPLELGYPTKEAALAPDNDNRIGPGLDESGAGAAPDAELHHSLSPTVTTRTLEPLYRRLVDLWCVSPEEASVLTLDLFHRLAAMAARNGVGVSPLSPFSTYYQALIRRAGGRGSARHAALVSRVAEAVSNGSTRVLERGMDRMIQDRVSPSLAAIFPLTSRINHDCQPNAELVTNFVDCHVDVRLLKDVRAGEEITINYVGRFGGRNKSLESRQTELRRKYLFACRCQLCCR